MYAARGVGTLWETDRGTAPDAVANLIGEVRASLLDLLASPASTTELAHRLRVTPTAVNQHLRAMRDAGLLTSSRHGRSVLYLRSELGDRLINSAGRSEEHTSELQSLMRTSYAVFCLKKKTNPTYI